MTTLLAGASGATGKLLAEQLLNRGQKVRAIVRAADRLPPELLDHPDLSVVEGTVLDFTDAEVAQHVMDCSSIACCLGHNLTFKGVYGHPRRLVTDSIRRLCRTVQASPKDKPAKFVLMNTAGNSNRSLIEPVGFAQRMVIGLVRLLLPPHVDNEKAADYLRTEFAEDSGAVEWCVVRPDSLTNETTVTTYDLHCSPTRSAIFNPGKTSRINVAHFMADLITDDATWSKWKGQMPVIYNRPLQDNES
ncbi:MAG: SDR family oxidoreductase [Pirellulales bacterium]|nr:SDR family oxidoreductase [Pirellulales bacterium]